MIIKVDNKHFMKESANSDRVLLVWGNGDQAITENSNHLNKHIILR